MTGDKKMLEINQRREGGRYLPPRDTFLLSVQGDVISAEAMGEKEFAKCFNPSNLSLSIVGEKKKDGYVVYDQDYTKVNFAKLLVRVSDRTSNGPSVRQSLPNENYLLGLTIFT